MSKTRQNSGVPIGSIAELRLTSGANEAVELLGYYTKGDGGGGTFYWDATSTDTDNGGTIIQATGVVDGRWIRNYSGAVNVKWFGAKGDGITDDTSAIQLAMSALDYYSTNTGLSIYIGYKGILEFVPGVYLISASIPLGSYTNIKGNNAIIKPTGTNNFWGFSGGSWLCDIDGLQFVGFNVGGLYISTGNIDTDVFSVTNCTFIDNGVGLKTLSASNQLNIGHCRFVGNDTAIYIESGDRNHIHDCWITSKVNMDGINPCQIYNHGNTSIDNIHLVPKPYLSTVVEPAWVNNYSSLTMENIRQGGEPGSFTLVNQFKGSSVAHPTTGSWLSLKNIVSYSVFNDNGGLGVSERMSLVRFFNVPDMVEISNIMGLIDTRALGFSNTVADPSTLLSSQNIFDVSGQRSRLYADGVLGYIEKYLSTSYGLIEEGSSGNGTYKKYADGTLICENHFSYFTNLASSGNIFYDSSMPDISFAHAFVKVPQLTIIAESASQAYWADYSGVNTTTTAYPRLWCAAATNTSCIIRATATGNWK